MHIMNDPNSPEFREHYKRHRRGRVIMGIVVIAIGVILMLSRMGYDIPSWLISWKMLLIVIGLAIGIKHRFSRPGWIIPVIIGSLFLLGDFYPELFYKPLMLPAVFILIGAYLIFRPSKHWKHRARFEQRCGNKDFHSAASQSSEDMLEIVAVFGGVKKNIVSHDFKGGEITCVFGGAEINLMQCDFNGKITLEANQVLGGTKLIIPSNWQIQSESVAILGGIEDKRPVGGQTDPNKILILKGVSVLGGLEILSY